MRAIPGRESGAVFARPAVRASGQIGWVLIRGFMDVRGPRYANEREHYDRSRKAPPGIVVSWDVSVYVLVHRVLVGRIRGEQE